MSEYGFENDLENAIPYQEDDEIVKAKEIYAEMLKQKQQTESSVVAFDLDDSSFDYIGQENSAQTQTNANMSTFANGAPSSASEKVADVSLAEEQSPVVDIDDEMKAAQEQMRMAQEKMKMAQEKAMQEKLRAANEKAEVERAAQEKAALEQAAREKAETERAAQEKAEMERAASEIAQRQQAQQQQQRQPQQQSQPQRAASEKVKPTFEDMLRGQAEYIHTESVKVRNDVQAGNMKNHQSMKVMQHNVQKTEQKVEDGFAAMQAANSELSRNVTGKLDRNDANLQKGTQQILHGLNMQTDQLLNNLYAAGRAGDADLNNLTPTQHYKNIKLSVLSFILSIMSIFLTLISFMWFISTIAANAINAILIINFVFAMLTAGGAIGLSFYQKSIFSPRTPLKAFLKSKNPTHEISKISLLLGLIVEGVALLMLIISIILVIV